MTLIPTHDPDRRTRAEARQSGRPSDLVNGSWGGSDHWGEEYSDGNCHGVPAYKNVVATEADRNRIRALHGDTNEDSGPCSLAIPWDGRLAYQCVEFVTRYYRDALGHTSIGGGNAQGFLQGSRGGLETHRFPTPTRPQAGDLVVQESGESPVGHVGIVDSVSGGDDGDAVVHVVQQNWSSSSARTSFTAVRQQEHPAQEPMYTHGGAWSGFRRKPGVTPVAKRGGTSESRWVGGIPDQGQGDYEVAPGETVNLDTVRRMYNLELEDLYRFNPAIGDFVVGPATIHVTDSFVPMRRISRTATIRYDATTVRCGPGTSYAPTAGTVGLNAGRLVLIYDSSEPSPGSTEPRWHAIAMYMNREAYVRADMCDDGAGSPVEI